MRTDPDVLATAVGAWNHGDLPGYLAMYATDVVVHGIPGLPPGLAGLRAYYEAFVAAFPDSTLHADDVLCDGDKVVCRFRITGVHKGSFQGLPATGQCVEVGGISILRFAGGLCIERWSCLDAMGLIGQLTAAADAA